MVELTLINAAKNLLDKIGIAATSLCAIHCLLLPFMLPLLPLIGASFLAQESFELGFLMSTMVLGFIALYSGYKRYHHQLYPFSLLFSGGFIYWQKDIFGADVEPYTVILGACLVVAAHVINMKLCRRCTDC
jgi:hypothetical protein